MRLIEVECKTGRDGNTAVSGFPSISHYSNDRLHRFIIFVIMLHYNFSKLVKFIIIQKSDETKILIVFPQIRYNACGVTL